MGLDLYIQTLDPSMGGKNRGDHKCQDAKQVEHSGASARNIDDEHDHAASGSGGSDQSQDEVHGIHKKAPFKVMNRD